MTHTQRHRRIPLEVRRRIREREEVEDDYGDPAEDDDGCWPAVWIVLAILIPLIIMVR